MVQRKLRIYHAPFDVGGNAYYLSRAERNLGLISKTFVYFKQWFGYPVDRDLKVGAGGNPFRSWRWWLGMGEILLRADVVHFNFGTSLLSDFGRRWVMADLPVLKAAGISTFATFQGCDSRLSDYVVDSFETNACLNCRSRTLCETGYNDYKREIISAARTHLDGIYAVNPDLLHNVKSAKFLPYSNCDTDKWVPPAEAQLNGESKDLAPVRILHAPTWREIKGTDYVIEAVEALKADGENVELVLVENVPHAEVRALYETADLLIDQVLVGWYGGLAVELMALGKPVVAFIRESDLKFVPEGMQSDLPVISATPDSLQETVRELVRDRAKLRMLGCRSRNFVEKWHAPARVAEVTTAAYKDAVAKRGGPVSTWNRVKNLASYGASHAKFATRTYLAVWRSRLYTWMRSCGPQLTAVTAIAAAPMVWLASALRLRILKRPSSLWGTTPILTLPLLAEADRRLGFRSETMTYTVYYITSGFDHVFQKQIEWLARKAPFLIPVYRRCLFIWALVKFDVFHFFFDEGILERNGRFGVSLDEMKWLKRFNKRLYLYAYGADVRTRKETEALGEFNCCTHCDKPGRHCLCDSHEGAKNMKLFSEYATQLVSMGDMVAYTPGARRLWYWPVNFEKLTYVGVEPAVQRPLRLFHAPNHGWAKGSHYLEKAVAHLKEKGIAIDLVMVSGVSNEVVVAKMAECDVVVDQLLIGWHGYTALEAMARGKPVICYIRDRNELIGKDDCPIISANPNTIEEILLGMVNKPRSELIEIGKSSRAYVERYYTVSAVSRRLADMYLETANFPVNVGKIIENRSRLVNGHQV